MSKVIAVLVALMISFSVNAAVVQRVCINIKDAKTGKITQQCKLMKKHKKLKGTAVPKK